MRHYQSVGDFHGIFTSTYQYTHKSQRVRVPNGKDVRIGGKITGVHEVDRVKVGVQKSTNGVVLGEVFWALMLIPPEENNKAANVADLPWAECLRTFFVRPLRRWGIAMPELPRGEPFGHRLRRPLHADLLGRDSLLNRVPCFLRGSRQAVLQGRSQLRSPVGQRVVPA